ncbi:MAG: hypothetical protein NC321_13030 [Clostridium sp.]|nr:hypothetical protein [Clostridium sp.]
MKAKSTYIILCLCMVLGMFTGCGEKEPEALPDNENNTALETPDEATIEIMDEATTDEAIIEIMDEETPESDSETLNAAGMPLTDNTALLASVKTQSGIVSEQYEYDKEGHMLRYLNTMRNHIWEYEYDSAGNLIRATDWHYGDDEWREAYRRLYTQTEYTYDGAGRLLGRMLREYSDDGNLDRCFVYADSGQQSWEMRYLFDADGNVAEQYRYEYDEMGNKTLSVEYDAEGKLNLFEGYECDTYVSYYPYSRYENTYDDSGNLIKITRFDYESSSGTTYQKFTYDDAGHLIKVEGVSGDPIVGEYTYEYTYNEKGYLVSSFSMTYSETHGKEYEYDDNGNCIKELNKYFERDEADNVSEYDSSVAQENQFDERNRLIRAYYGYRDDAYDYTYETIGVADEDYPYDKIEIYGKIGERWDIGGRIIKVDALLL